MTGEVFEANSGEISGLSNMLVEIGADLGDACSLIGEHGALANGADAGRIFVGLAQVCDLTRSVIAGEFADMSEWQHQTSVELNAAAWFYHDTDAKNYDAFNRVMEGNSFPPAYDSPAAYSRVHELDIKAPPPPSDVKDVRTLVEETIGWMSDVDEKVNEAFGWSPIDFALEPLKGPWNELERLGGVYRTSCEGVEKCGENLGAATARVRESWKGQASQRFHQASTSQSKAMNWWGPVGRIIDLALQRASDEIQKAVIEVAETIRDLLKQEVQIDGAVAIVKIALKKTPVVGWGWQAERIYNAFKEGYDRCQTLVNQIQETVDAIKSFIEAIKEPIESAKNEVEKELRPIKDKIEPLKKAVEEVAAGAEVAQDFAKVADVTSLGGRERKPFYTGNQNEPWADAS